ncbi:DUF6263 family protein [Pedobacter punctiformis]|uniref:DUF6263 family protein n=1 Tax=Pedobacter punctiformis TaxID=3004097 RepID=A0ABT4L9D8_9SPHI|nr:DUF6263 family protein [Pedobacter sp. HCMS5-2]MCZ4243434.1 DUF6263 family protein [Pedobacter sp. HCMS5-2]
MKFLTTIVLSCLISISSFAQKTYIIKQNYPVGKKYDYNITSDQIIKEKISGQEINLTQNIGTDYTFDITDGKNGDKNIKVIYNRITMKSVAMGNTMIMDSDQGNTDQKNPFAGLKGATFNMVFGVNGEIKSVTRIDEMLDRMVSKMTSDSSQVKLLKNSLSKQFNAEAMKQTMESSFKLYPGKPVKIGDSWTVDTKMQMSMPIETNTTYLLREVNDGIATLNVKGTLVSKGNFEAMGNTMETDLKGTNSGDVQLDLKTGMILNSHLRIEMFGRVKTMGQDIDFEIQGINKITGKALN